MPATRTVSAATGAPRTARTAHRGRRTRALGSTLAALALALAATGCLAGLDEEPLDRDAAGSVVVDGLAPDAELTEPRTPAAADWTEAELPAPSEARDADRARDDGASTTAEQHLRPAASPTEPAPVEPMMWSGPDDEGGGDQGEGEDGDGNEPDPQPWITASSRGGQTGGDTL